MGWERLAHLGGGGGPGKWPPGPGGVLGRPQVDVQLLQVMGQEGQTPGQGAAQNRPPRPPSQAALEGPEQGGG